MSDEHLPAAKRRNDWTDLTAEVVVLFGSGDQKEKFTVAKGFLTITSEAFQKCCNGQWEEGSTKTITLPETDPEVFQSYIMWLYTVELATSGERVLEDGRGKHCSVNHGIARIIFAALTQLAILADMLLNIAFFGNVVADAFLQTTRDTAFLPAPYNGFSIYSNIVDASPIKRLFLDTYATSVSADFMKPERENFHPEMVFDVMLRLVENMSSGQEPRKQ